MPKKYPTLTPHQVIAILQARGFVQIRVRGSHATYQATIRGIRRSVTVDLHYDEYSVRRIRDMMDQAGLSREEFYGSTKATAKKINLRASRYPIPLE
ncbi:MAG TPA: type II toxin-antitoxin system HicA family toxin [Anaerolineae bacterium]|nr:type II toxin-antitoxin system HicA family toxin [Anaerolineae bacterium]